MVQFSPIFCTSLIQQQSERDVITTRQWRFYLRKHVNIGHPLLLTYQLKNWDSASTKEKTDCKEKASETCSLICKIIAPNDGGTLFQSLYEPRPTASNELITLMKALAKVPTRNLKTQILSLYAYAYPVKTLQELHEPYARLTQWQIRRARAHAKTVGPGYNVIKPVHNRISMDMSKVEYFVDFINRPYYRQDVAFGTRTLRLDSGARFQCPMLSAL